MCACLQDNPEDPRFIVRTKTPQGQPSKVKVGPFKRQQFCFMLEDCGYSYYFCTGSKDAQTKWASVIGGLADPKSESKVRWRGSGAARSRWLSALLVLSDAGGAGLEQGWPPNPRGALTSLWFLIPPTCVPQIVTEPFSKAFPKIEHHGSGCSSLCHPMLLLAVPLWLCL